MELYIAVIIGAVIYALMDYAGSKKEVLTIKYGLMVLANVLAGMALIWMLELEPKQFMVSNFDFTRVVAVSFGVVGQKLFKASIKFGDKLISSKLGIGKK